MVRRIALILILLLLAFAPAPGQRADIRVGSKKFTESVILGEMIRLAAVDAGVTSQHLPELGGTRLVFDALVQGELDVYPEYTGTLTQELFADRDIQSDGQLRAALDELGIGMSEPLGFNNTYALGVTRQTAEKFALKSATDLSRVPGLKYGFSNEFMEREDGWNGLRQAYSLAPAEVTGMDHDIAYRQLQLGLIDVIDVYTTDARIEALDIVVLDDDRGYFPRYDAVILYRRAIADDYPDALDSILRLGGAIPATGMIACNRQVELQGRPEAVVAAEFVGAQLQIEAVVRTPGRTERLIEFTVDHLELVRRSLLPAILLAVPLGIVAARYAWWGHVILGVTGVFQTIPSLALLVMLLPLAAWLGFASIGAGSGTAVIALFLYSLLPIVRNTHAGLTSIDPALRESAEVLNLPGWFRLFEIELPLASRSILAGIKTAVVMNIGFATLGALVGAGGYGQPILSGIRLANTGLILEGAIPAAVLALVAQGAFEVIERVAVPRGLRIVPGSS